VKYIEERTCSHFHYRGALAEMSEGDAGEPVPARERVYEVFADRTLDTDVAVGRTLEIGTGRLDVELGFLTRIDDGTQRIVRVVGSHDEIRSGAACPLDRAYCKRTVQTDGLLSVQDAERSDLVDDDAYETFQLGCYVGANVVVEGTVYGTICFADADRRDRPFSEAEQLFVELVARLVSQAFERREYDRRLRDRTDRLEAEKQRFEGIAETSFDILYRIAPDTTFTYVSAAVERILGYDPEELVGDPFTDYVVASSLPATMEAFGRLMEGESVEHVEVTFSDAAGEEVVLDINARPVSEAGEVSVLQGVARNVTERLERERTLRVKNRAIEDAQVGITIADATRDNQPVVYANDAFCRLTGYSESEILGTNCRRLQGPGTDEAAIRRLAEGIDRTESVDVELLNYREEGSPFWNHVTVTPVEDDHGAVTHYVGFQEDVTERKRTERLVELLNRVLRHNMRNDMNVLLGYSDMVDDPEVGDDVDVGERIERTALELSSLSERARELETYARRDRDPTRLDPESLLSRVVEPRRSSFPAAELTVAVETDRQICAGPEVERALAELVENALSHDPSAGTRVSLVAADARDFVAVKITDDGPGIPPVESAVVESGRETALEHGSGLGLWLVNWIVTRYGGSFQIRPRDHDEGTVATVKLPSIGPETSVEDAARRPTALFR
jgi:PAS domain S-box-containing protein